MDHTTRPAGIFNSISGFRQVTGSLLGAFVAEREQWLHWLPVGLAAGIGLYFSLGEEPSVQSGPILLVLSGIFMLVMRRNFAGVVTGLALCAVSTGFTAAQIRTANVDAPGIEKKLWGHSVTGAVWKVSRSAKTQYKLFLCDLAISDFSVTKTPRCVSLNVRTKGDDVRASDRVQVRAVLLPPPSPAIPGGFDYGRKIFFEGIGAVGYAIGPVSRLEQGAEVSGGIAGFLVILEQLRDRIAQRFMAGIPGEDGGVAAAITTGIRGGIPDHVYDNMQDSGLAHLLAISGLHLGLVTGLVFMFARASLALFPPATLKYPVKKWAAGLAAIGALGYFLISGGSLPTQRAFLMCNLVLLAIIFDRNPFSMRLVMFAAVVILLITPEALLSVSFQMSFAAVIGLIAAYEIIRKPLSRWRQTHRGAGYRLLEYLALILLTTIVAELALAAITIYHFNRLTLYGLIGNFAAVPLMAFWIMPWALVALLLMPFGLEFLAMWPLGQGIHAMLWVAEKVAALDGAVIIIGSFSTLALAVMSFGSLWLCLWSHRIRLIGLVIIAAGILLAMQFRSPDVLIDSTGKLMAIKNGEGDYIMSSLTRAKYARDVWLRHNGQKTKQKWPEGGQGTPSVYESDEIICEAVQCLYSPGGNKALASGAGRSVPRIILNRAEDYPVEECARADVIFSLTVIRERCPSPVLNINWFDLYYKGAHAIWIDRIDERVWRFHIKSAAGEQGKRPWSNAPSPPDWKQAYYRHRGDIVLWTAKNE